MVYNCRLTIEKIFDDGNSKSDNDDEDLVMKPSSNYRIVKDRAPNSHTMLYRIDDLILFIEAMLVYRCMLMLKDFFGDNT